MEKTLIHGYEEIEKGLGYSPTFHDDMIISIMIELEKVEIVILVDSNNNHLSLKKVKISFFEVKQLNLQGMFYGVVCIIRDIIQKKEDDFIETTIESSLGVEANISSKIVNIELVD